MTHPHIVPLCWLVLSLASCGRGGTRSSAQLTVRLDTAAQCGPGASLQYPGRVVPASEANASFRVPGQISRMLVSDGDRVRAGQVLAELDAADYEAQLRATEAECERVRADAARVMGLYEDGGATASDNDKARYGLRQMEAKLEAHRNQLSYTRLRAPFSGTVQHCHFEAGETVAAGMPVVSLVSDEGLEVEINLPASSYTRRASFLSYSCAMDVLPGLSAPLRLVSVLPKANANQLYAMRLRFQGKAPGAAPGMSAWVTIETGGGTSPLVSVPSTALVEERGAVGLFVYSPRTGRVARRLVSVAELRADGTAAVEGGVRAGELVVSSGAHHLAEGARVTPLKPVPQTNVGGLL